ncbi:hypothetical protein GNP80_14540 [Aliivibrio fischeri]|uniref:hypothetical protein n=1 Tax=Aliivibrio fischeri TaxID=668 RepID=UPI0012DAC763|nr:hypothetical protein [Aliivibrio fischeri]MUK93647.1 hypothetical protein [Aliivibrio fischeri]
MDNEDPEHTIYAERPWTMKSKAVVCLEDSIDVSSNLSYFLEIFLVLDVIEDLSTNSIQRIIEYAEHDS